MVKKFIIFNKLMLSVLRCKLVCLKLCFLVFLGSSKWKTKTRCSCYLSLVQLPAVGHLLKKNKNFVEWVSFMLSLPFFSKRRGGFLDVQPARIGSFTRQIVGCSLDSVSLGCVNKFIIFNKLMFSVLRCKLVCLKLCFLFFSGFI